MLREIVLRFYLVYVVWKIGIKIQTHGCCLGSYKCELVFKHWNYYCSALCKAIPKGSVDDNI